MTIRRTEFLRTEITGIPNIVNRNSNFLTLQTSEFQKKLRRNLQNRKQNRNSAYDRGPRNWKQKSEFPTKADCTIASHCAAFVIHPVDVPPPLSIPAGCSVAYHCATSTAHPLSASLPLNAPPPPPIFCLPFVCPGWLSHPFSSTLFCRCGGKSKGVNLALTCTLGEQRFTFQQIDMTATWADCLGGWIMWCNTQILMARTSNPTTVLAGEVDIVSEERGGEMIQ